MNEIKNYGIDWERELRERSVDDYLVGSNSLPCLGEIPQSERDKYLPKGEIQRAKEDMMDCASRGPVNILSAKFTYLIKSGKMPALALKWLKDNGYIDTDGTIDFSDAFVAIQSGTTRQGNSLKAPLQAIHDGGLIPKKVLPLEQWMGWDDYHNPSRIKPSMVALGKEFAKRFTINYERTEESRFQSVLDLDLLNVAGFAWPEPVGGEYPRTEGSPNHCFILYKKPAYYAFDNYIDTVDGDYVKKLASNYDFYATGYRVIISAINTDIKPTNWVLDILTEILKALKDIGRLPLQSLGIIRA